MQIKLIQYPYKDFEVGELVDLGEQKNKSMVALQRAVWAEIIEKPSKKASEDEKILEEKQAEVKEIKAGEEIETEPKEKKFLQNELKEQIEEKKAKTSKKSFWDKLK